MYVPFFFFVFFLHLSFTNWVTFFRIFQLFPSFFLVFSLVKLSNTMASGSGSASALGGTDEFPWTNDDSNILETTDVELLKKAWRNEKTSPEILHFQSDLVQRAREQIQLLVSVKQSINQPTYMLLFQIWTGV